MYQNSIRRTSTNIRPNSHPQFFIRRSEIAFDERLPFIESILETLLESRFGPGGVYHSVSRSSGHPEPGAAHLYNLCDAEPDGLVPCYAVSPLPSLRRRAGYQVVEDAYRRAKQMGLLAAAPNARSSTPALTLNQGRGSPSSSGTHDPTGRNASVNERVCEQISLGRKNVSCRQPRRTTRFTQHDL